MGSIQRLSAVCATVALASVGATACSSVLNPGGSEAITVYSNSLTDGRAEWLTEKANEAGFTLQLVDLGGGDVYNRLVAEKSNPVADVVFGLNDIYFQRLLAQDIVEPNTPSWSDKVDTSSVDPSETFWPIVREPIMLVCNTAAASKPTDWLDLWTKPEFDKRYEVPAALGGATTQVVLSSILSRYADPNGKLGISDEGWSNVEQYFAHGSRAVEGTDLFARMKNSEVDCGQMWLAGKKTREKQYDIKSDAVRPPVGVPMVRQSIALIKGGKNPEKAKEFIDWFGAAEMQGAWSKEFGTAPTNKDAVPLGDPDVIEFTDSFQEQELDWGLIAENLDKWIEEIQLKYVK